MDLQPHQYVFIGGYMHSGTTLLGQVIANLPSAFRPDHETKFLEFVERYRQLFPDLSEPEQAASFRSMCWRLLTEGFRFEYLSGRESTTGVKGNPSPSDAHLAAFLQEAQRLLEEAGRTIFVEHTGTNIFGHPDLIGSTEEVYLVNIVRDPRDVLASKKTRRAAVFTDRYRPEQQRRKHHEKSFDAVWDTVSWRSFVRAGDVAAATMPDRYLMVRYEDVVSDPARELARIATLLGIDKPPAAVQVGVNNAADAGVQRSGVDEQSVGRWKTVLSAGEAATCTWLARRELHTLGYTAQPVRPTLAVVGPLAHAGVEPAVRLYRRFRLGGLDAARTILRNYAERVRRSRRG